MSMRNIYRKVAKKHGVSVAEVKQEMQKTINFTYQKPNGSQDEKRLQASVPCQGEIPTYEEFIKHFAKLEAVEKPKMTE